MAGKENIRAISHHVTVTDLKCRPPPPPRRAAYQIAKQANLATDGRRRGGDGGPVNSAFSRRQRFGRLTTPKSVVVQLGVRRKRAGYDDLFIQEDGQLNVFPKTTNVASNASSLGEERVETFSDLHGNH